MTFYITQSYLSLLKREKEKQVRYCYSLTKLSTDTVYSWLQSFGFKDNLSKKRYYIDGHEKPDTVAYQKTHVSKYL